jgi:hypothetical protein
MMNFICLILSFEFIILVKILDKMDYYYFGKFGENLMIWIFEKLKLREVDSNFAVVHCRSVTPWDCILQMHTPSR